MVRVLAVAAAFGLAGAFRVDHRKNGAVSTADEEGDAVVRGLCTLSGDPHVTVFDGGRWDPMYAHGHYWIVKTKTDKIKVQGKYAYCGRKHPTRTAPTCMVGVAVSGSFIGDRELSIQAPCDKDITTGQCLNKGVTAPRISYNGKEVTSVDDDGIKVTVKNNRISVTLPEQMAIDIGMAGKTGNAYSWFNTRLFMVRGSGGEQCGHCGNFNGKKGDDIYYDKAGQLLPQFQNTNGGKLADAEEFCESNVDCSDRLIKGDPGCPENEKEGGEDEKCPQEKKDKFEKECREKLEAAIDPAIAGKVPVDIEEGEVEDCVEDACKDEGFIDDDVEDAKETDEVGLKAGIW